QSVDPGFRAEGVLTLELTLTGARYPNAAPIREAYRDLFTKLESLPGVEAAGGVTALPLSNFFAWGPITIEGRTRQPGEAFINADQRTVGGRYFEAMHIPLVRGRLFSEQDRADQPRVVIIDQRLANDLFPGQDPVGRRLKYGDADSESPWETIIGVVGNVSQYALGADSRIALYRPITQSGARSQFVVVRTSGDPRGLAADVTRMVRSVDADLPIYRLMPMSARIADSLAQRRLVMWMLGLFAAVALALAVVGVGGVMAYLVARGQRDLGIRLALGATPASVRRLVLRQGLTLACAGVVIGAAAAWLGGRLLTGLLFGVSARDPLTFIVMTLVLIAAASGAVAWPAIRASRIDPLVSLRHE
ncbi:MAG: ABC transporter permease, partial [Vicinamibacterales bacterium]